MTTTLIGDGYVLPMTGGTGPIANGAVLVDDDRIVAVGEAKTVVAQAARIDKRIDASGCVILPGLINTHCHLAGALLKGLTEDLTEPGEPFKIALGIQEGVATKEDMYWPGMLHGVEMLKTGTTCINECWWHQPESARIVHDLGLRAIVAAEIREVDSSTVGFGRMEREWDSALLEQGIDEQINLIEQWHGKANGRITCRVGPDGPDRLRPESLARLVELADKYQVGLHTHLCAVPGESEFMEQTWGKRSVPLLKEVGMLRPDFIGAHCVFVDDEDIELMRETGAKMSHTAFLVAKRGIYPPMDRIYRAGLGVGLGTDWLSNDMWNVMRAAIVAPRVLYGDLAVRTAADVLHMATLGGAVALGLEQDIGSLEAGKKADIIAVDVATPWCQPLGVENLVPNLVYNANGRDVRHVLVDGVQLVDEHQLTQTDETEVLTQGTRVAQSVWQRAKALGVFPSR